LDVDAQHSFKKVKFSKIGADLSNTHVSSILQDSRGFLWIATQDGLNRFDGYSISVYRNNPEDTTSLLKNLVLRLFEDSRGVLWVSTSTGGLHIYNRELDNFKRVSRYSFDCEVTEFHEDDTSVWIAGLRRDKAFVERISKVSGVNRYYELLDSRNPIHALIPASNDEFWVGVRGDGLFRWNPGKGTIYRQGAPINLQRIAVDGLGRLWIAARGGLQRYDPLANTHVLYNTRSTPALPVDDVLTVYPNGSYVWIGTENGGLCRLDTNTNELSTFQYDKHDPNSLPDNSIHALYKDSQDRIWIGTHSNGIGVIDKLYEKFTEVDVRLENSNVKALLFDSRNRLWIGTEGGLVKMTANGQKYYKHTADKKSLGANPVLAIYEDNKQRIWIGTWGGGLNLYNETHDNFTNYMPDERKKRSLSSPHVFAICQSSKTQELLIGTYGGLNVLSNENSGSFECIREQQFEFNNYIHTIYEDKEGTVWVGTIDELIQYDPIKKRLERFQSNLQSDSTHISGVCTSIMEDSRRRLWVGTWKGLYLLVKGKVKRKYTTRDGLQNNMIQSILEDNSGRLWLSTTAGLSRFTPDNIAFRNYDVSDGLPSNDFKSNSGIRYGDRQLMFGGKGITIFSPDSISDNPFIPNVFITDLSIRNSKVRPGDSTGILQYQLSETKMLTLPPAFNVFSLSYVALNFTAPEKNRYAYKLEGFDDDWNEVGDQRSVMFTNLDPGIYTFKVKASNNDGRWNEAGAALTIRILPPWYRTWWANISSIVLVIFSAVSFYKIRIRSIRKQNKNLETQVHKRTQQLKLQNDELIQSREEIAAQRDIVSAQNLELQRARATIELQNREIIKRNETLEVQVEERTRELVEYNQQLEQFAFISAHNLRAPVARILGLGHVLELNKSDSSDLKMIIDKIVLTTQELDRVVKDLSTVLEMRRNSSSVIVPVNLEEELRLIKVNIEKEIRETNTVFIEDLSKGARLWTVKPYLDSILLNLICNAIKYRHPEKTPVITIRSEIKDNYFVLSIKDNGLGMDMSLCRDKIFTLYRRFHHHIEGKGMGLYLVKTQMIAMGGKVDVQSKVNEGTTFYLYFKHIREPAESKF
jgi:ligand-binding sensor domain-containing protein/signal transduction histidine kinase